ncbi:hypothetical protein TrVE_jg8031 [Triparma verrucosa]|uniref:Uncharacterized protein n=1 Tax=Triparma verrucosa TaxID=1606542 RepID=A0A9W7C9F9_9STRA|nr:hypothetical protein TrVE_jg8031 [Triparma verrucosa]
MVKLSLPLVLLPATAAYEYQTLYYNQTLDHTQPFHPSQARWSHRYLLNDEFWSRPADEDLMGSSSCPGPIMFYTGNEGPVDGFWSGNGFMMEMAESWGGLIVFGEERYYGESIPSEDYSFMSTQQVLEDYVELLDFVKNEYDAQECPVIAFGGSYGGTLTTFFRAGYPHAIQGGLASSAPVGNYDPDGWSDHGVDSYTFSDIIVKQYTDADPKCLEKIWAATDALNSATSQDLVTAFNLCDATGLGPSSQSGLFLYGLEGLPQLNYPYEIGSMPAWPVQAACDMLVASGDDVEDLIKSSAVVTAMALGYSLDGQCFKTLDEGPGNVPGDGPGSGPWGYQSCTETLHLFNSRGPDSGGIRSYKFDMEKVRSICSDTWGDVQPNPTALTERYGGYRLGDGLVDVSNIIWSVGDIDPWGGGCFHPEYAKEDAEANGLYYFPIDKGAHHYDLRGKHDDDTESVTEVREKEREIIKSWIVDFV